jgi:hypothetical protein
MKDKTIKIDTGFYKKTVNKDQFVEKCLGHVQEVGSLVDIDDNRTIAKI